MTMERPRVTEQTTVQEVLTASPATEVIFEAYGCNPMWECTEEHREDYQLVELSLVCHIQNVDTLIEDINAFLELEAEDAEADSLAAAA